jgi:hypothetical protein
VTGGGSNSHYSGRDSHMGTSIAFSSLGSCHSWLPEQMAAASSFFSGRTDTVDNEDDDAIVDDHNVMMQQHGDYHSMGVAADGSMAHSAADYYSGAGESIGGASLTRVFDHQHHYSQQQQQYSHHNDPHNHYHQHQQPTNPTMQQQMMPSPTFSHRELHQIPSWERSLRSKSPASCNDDESLISKTDSKGASSSVLSMNNNMSNMDEMAWTRE